MDESARKQRNNDRLQELYPTFRERLARVIQALEAKGLRPRIQDAWRSKEDQERAYAQKHSKVRFGFHNVTGTQGQKEALAVDLLDDNAPLSPGKSYLLRLAAAAEAEGLTTGIRWGVPNTLQSGIDAAIAAKNWDANVKIGWDPTHVQPTDITIAEAKAGKRPA